MTKKPNSLYLVVGKAVMRDRPSSKRDWRLYDADKKDAFLDFVLSLLKVEIDIKTGMTLYPNEFWEWLKKERPKTFEIYQNEPIDLELDFIDFVAAVLRSKMKEVKPIKSVSELKGKFPKGQSIEGFMRVVRGEK